MFRMVLPSRSETPFVLLRCVGGGEFHLDPSFLAVVPEVVGDVFSAFVASDALNPVSCRDDVVLVRVCHVRVSSALSLDAIG